ncbi:MAG: orotidine-5'-phosphate decarboxylase [Candidatus Eremiobacteraeota bacterium]|nr:orotidine-5'-phosphate decarboxylase [Candidatus Eremiobacteraeota bacterium]MBC5828045.1 orotidine-5'-phosphate decarboxylase [Candidatus Eremiobacteraeota bacterium]
MTQLIIALDEPDFRRALDLVSATESIVSWYKVGYQAYYGYGPRIIDALRHRNKSIFLDLKLHDIPRTVGAAVASVAHFDISLLTLHAAGGARMLEAAVAARDEVESAHQQATHAAFRPSGSSAPPPLRLLAVTVLTSMDADDLQATGIDRAPSEVAAARAALAARAGMDGVVCAVPDAPLIRAVVPTDFLLLCPGIRGATAAPDDQRRVATAAEAVKAGANFIVAGRAVSESPDAEVATREILKEVEDAGGGAASSVHP